MKPGKYSRLADVPGWWRVDGITSLSGTRAIVHFSEVVSEWHENGPYRSDFVVRPTAQNAGVLDFRIHVASIRHFITGTVWHAGECVYSPRLFGDAIQIDTSAAQTCMLEQMAYGKIGARSPIPHKYFPSNCRDKLESTRFTIVPIVGQENRYVVIPQIELVRFYIGVSSEFLTEALHGGFGSVIDWGPKLIYG